MNTRIKIIFMTLLTVSLLIIALHFLFHPVRILSFSTSIFYMDEQITLSAFFTIVVSFVIGFITLINTHKLSHRPEQFLWKFFGWFFIFLSVDEYFEIHEYANHLIKQQLVDTQIGTLAKLSWIFPLSLFIFIIFITFIWLAVREKDKWVKLPLILGLICYTLVLIFEVVGAKTFGQNIYILFVGLEEGLEMISGSLFLLSAMHKFHHKLNSL